MRRQLAWCVVVAIAWGVACHAEEPAGSGATSGALKEPAANAATEGKTPAEPFQDEPAAHALYDQMIEALRKADSLSVVASRSREGRSFKSECTYRMWLKKPNYFRVEVESPTHEKGGVLIGDGDTLWIYWPQGRPQWELVDESEADQKTRATSYMKKLAPLGQHSIWHEMVFLGGGMGSPVIDPSTFHGYTDCMQRYIDGVKGIGVEKVGDEKCEGIEVSMMKHQRSWYLWLSTNDHLPRKLKEIVRVSYDIVTNEEWSSVTLNADTPNAMFEWKPPEGWTEWRLPSDEERLLKPGVRAPDFELASADGQAIRLSDYRRQMVWFYIWRAG